MLQIAAAYVIDIIFGDPKWIIHPVVIIGKCITFLEQLFRRISNCLPDYRIFNRIFGVILTMIIVAGTYFMTRIILNLAYEFNYYFGFVFEIWFLSTTLATKSLGSAGKEIYLLLSENNIQRARNKVGLIVGRDTEELDEAEITRATVETVAENIVDGITAPMFFAFLGGLPLAMAYKAVNTLDSMVGYKNERYRDFGWASARLDDMFNYIPARITGILLIVVIFLSGKNFKGAWQAIIRDAPKHPSPNSGIPEAAIAGALGIRLGGLNYYSGVPSFRPYMGEKINQLAKKHICETINIMYITSVVFLLFGLAIQKIKLI